MSCFLLLNKSFSNLKLIHFSVSHRYVCWSAYLLKKSPKLESKLGSMGIGSEGDMGAALDYTTKLPLDQKVYFQYYVQDDTDDGVLMNTKIKIKEV